MHGHSLMGIKKGEGGFHVSRSSCSTRSGMRGHFVKGQGLGRARLDPPYTSFSPTDAGLNGIHGLAVALFALSWQIKLAASQKRLMPGTARPWGLSTPLELMFMLNCS